MPLTELKRRIRRWIDADPDPRTRAAGEALLAEGDVDRLRSHFGDRLSFGTAGLRAALGPGPGRMNQAMVRWATAGFAAHVAASIPDAAKRGLVVGFDGRHGSRPFAEEAARVLASAGLRVMLYDRVAPTPQVAHAVRWLGAAGGVVVTASHNPPQDNGYKVSWADGAQIVPPHDVAISAAIDALGGPWAVDPKPRADLEAAGVIAPVPAEAEAVYLDAIQKLRVWERPGGLKVVYTAMHGVARRLITATLERAGHTVIPVAAQADPDPDFPTVAFPNPEEPGALDLALAEAKAHAADLLVANDPDGDRLAVAVPDGEGGFRPLSGNQVGVLLADELLRHGAQSDDRLVATTIVSTGMLRRVAEAHGAAYAETLTGFKWIAAEALKHDGAGGRFVMGFEEALGYSIGPVVRDKDGISAALCFCDLAARCKAEGISVLDRLTALYRAHGLFSTRQHSIKLPGAAGKTRIAAMMGRLRGAPPRTLDGVAVVRVRDLHTGYAVEANGSTAPIDLPRSNVLAFDLADGGRVLARPSGTEPKLKLYFEVRSPLDGPPAEAEAIAQARLDRLQADLLGRLEA